MLCIYEKIIRLSLLILTSVYLFHAQIQFKCICSVRVFYRLFKVVASLLQCGNTSFVQENSIALVKCDGPSLSKVFTLASLHCCCLCFRRHLPTTGLEWQKATQ